MLPKLDVPIHELKLVSTGKTIRFRPFLVKEQKLFLMASESDEPKEVVNVIRQVLKNCVLDEIDIDQLLDFLVMLAVSNSFYKDFDDKSRLFIDSALDLVEARFTGISHITIERFKDINDKAEPNAA